MKIYSQFKNTTLKKLILILAIAGFVTQAQAQKLKEKYVPEVVTSAFYQTHPALKDVDWMKDGLNYQASYDLNKMDMSATYSVTGMLIKSEMEIVTAALPPPVMEYVKKNYQEDELKKASKLTNIDGIITYTAEVKDMSLTFDSTGNFLSSAKD